MHTHLTQAAGQLTSMLKMYRQDHPLVMGILPGGVEMGAYIARQLKVGFTPLIVQSLIYPLGRKFVFGAVAEDGSVYLHPTGEQKISQEMIDIQEDLAVRIIGYRKKTWRRLYPLPNLGGRTVILSNDHITTGASMVAAITMCRNQGAYRIVVAIPAAPRSKIPLLRQQADVVITLPQDAIASAAKDAFLSQVTTDEEALALLKPAKTSPPTPARSRVGATERRQPGKRSTSKQNTGIKTKLAR
ncbi:phosphoribosyltransferase family protein [Paraflavitalea pollutisoli]|uniref:phosphoribosyltransferase family protein n=1 Tax=Paraflavitalea pollutisoli TaxID=3034143 RepID=UPI0023EAE934|nr:phosphoribosyltransferase family protein [Paraflavitalea sp. H1-2-19X]